MNKRAQVAATVLLLAALAAGIGFAQATKPQKPASAVAGKAVIKHTPGMTVQSLAARSDQDQVELASGKRVSVGYLRSLDALSQAVRTPRTKNPNFARLLQQGPQAFKVKPATGGTRISGAASLANSLKTLQDKDTVQLPSGRVATMQQIRLVQSLVEQKVGRKIDVVPGRPMLTGPAIKITSQTTKDEWKTVLQKPDNTILEAPTGQRITVYELKQYVSSQAKNKPVQVKQAIPAKPQPAQKGRPK
jgi:hypothetical protein